MEKRFSVCNELFGKMDLEPSLDLLAKEDFQGVEVAPYTIFEDFSPPSIEKGLRRLQKGLQNSGLSFVGFHWLFVKPEGLRLVSENDQERKRAWEHLHRLIDLPGELGGGVLVLGSPKQRATGGIPKWKAEVYFQEGLAEAAERAYRSSSVILLEALSSANTDRVNTLEEAEAYVRKINNPGLSSMFDFHNTGDETDPWELLIAKHRSIIRHVHLNNQDGTWPRSTEIMRFKPAFDVLSKTHFEGWVSLEIFTVPPDPVIVLRETRQFLKELWEA
jgi:sugar phosphate isomerase/epimerase